MTHRNDVSIGLAIAWARHRHVHVGYLWINDPRCLAIWIGEPSSGKPTTYVDRGSDVMPCQRAS